MAELDKKLDQLVRGLKRLEYMQQTFIVLSTVSYAEDEDAENERITHRDALIKRFEFCYDLMWKFLKTYLYIRHGIQATSPRTVFQECFKQELVSQQEAEALLNMIDDRNQTVHIYDEQIADLMSQHIISYYPVLNEVALRLAATLR